MEPQYFGLKAKEVASCPAGHNHASYQRAHANSNLLSTSAQQKLMHRSRQMLFLSDREYDGIVGVESSIFDV